METKKAELGVNVGKFAADGSVEAPVTHCPFTGQLVAGLHSNRERVSGTPYFYRLDANSLHLVGDEWRQAFAEQVKQLEGNNPVRRGRTPDKAENQSEES
jgi:hypothetical protein